MEGEVAMEHWILYDSDGVIKRCGSCPKGQAVLQEKEGCSLLIVPFPTIGLSKTHYVRDGNLAEKGVDE